MTTTTETDEGTTIAPDEAPSGLDAAAEDDGQGDEQEQTPNQEAAKYRRRLRETEAERDRLATQVEAFRRGEVERMVGTALVDPADLWVGGVTLDELVDKEDGSIDAEEVEAAVAKVLAAHPSWAPKFPDLGQGARGGGGGSITWADALSSSGRGGGRP